MSGHTKTVIYRCPLCFNAGNDVYLKQEQHTYSCLRCSFTGTEAEILAMYDDFRKRYRLMEQRVTLEMQRNM